LNPQLAELAAALGSPAPGCPISESVVFINPTTYQGQAASFVVSILNTQPSLTNSKLVQYYALACIYYATSGDNWVNHTHWLSSTIDPCDASNGWAGVDCTSNMVVDLNLANNNLAGTMPCETVLLSGDHPSQAGALSFLFLDNNVNLKTGSNVGSQWITGLGSSLSTCIAFFCT
jgi:hypothetical protein